MEKKNTGLIIIIVVLALMVGFLGGYIIINKLIDKDVNTNEKTDNNVELSYDLNKAKELMDKYKIKMPYGDDEYIESLNDELLKNILALQNAEISQNYSCKLVFGKNELLIGEADFCFDFEGTYEDIEHEKSVFYKYSDVLMSKKSLFGKNSSLEKKNINWNSQTFGYNSEHDVFVKYIYFGGGDSPVSKEERIESAKISNDTLKITVEKKEINYDEDIEIIEHRDYLFAKEEQRYYLFEIKEIK